MSHRNATDARLQFRGAARDFRQTYLPRIAQARLHRAGNAGGVVPEDVATALEAHGRDYLIDSLLAALNWNVTSASGAYFANLIPENPIQSVETTRQRYIDYLGFDTETQKPLLVVEAKRPGSPLPAKTAPAAAESLSEILLAGLRGEALRYDWGEWLAQVRDYVASVKDLTQVCPKRVILTDGYWCFVFLDPETLFLSPGSATPAQICAYVADGIDGSFHGEIEARFHELFGYLEYNQLADSMLPLSPTELLFHFGADEALEALHGLILNYVSYVGMFRATPVIEITPLIFLRKPGARWFRVQSQVLEMLPGDEDGLPEHLATVAAQANALRQQVAGVLPGNHTWLSLEQHYFDTGGFRQLPGVRGSGNRYVIVTGQSTHYLREQSSVPGCVYHLWSRAHADNVAAPAGGAVAVRSTDPGPRVWFPDGATHHCAHSAVETIKSNTVTAANRAQCGSRSAQDSEAFCEIRGFERHLCCRTCNFETVCEKAAVFQPPCQRPVAAVVHAQPAAAPVA